jgi:hypothetical protein
MAFGVGLMALIFYSSRKEYDEPAGLIKEPGVDPDDVQRPDRRTSKLPEISCQRNRDACRWTLSFGRRASGTEA